MPDIPDELYEQCLRALHHAPADKPSRALLEDMCSVDPEALRNVIAIAFQAGVESAPWHYSATLHDGDNGHREFGTDAQAAFAYAGMAEGYPQLPVLRQRRGPWQRAVLDA